MGSSVNVDDGRVKKVRIAQFKPGLARIVIETDGQASFNASLMANPPRLVIDVQGNSPAGETACADSKSSGDCSRRGDDEEGKVVRASEKSLTASSDSQDSLAPKKVIVEADADDPSSEPAEQPTDKPSKTDRQSKLTPVQTWPD